MAPHRKRRSDGKEKHLLAPIEGGLVDKIQPLLQYIRPFPPPGSYAEVFLLLKNLTDQRIEGWLTLTPPAGWNIEPGTLLMIAIRPRGTISAEFYLSVPDAPAAGPHLLQIEVTADDQFIAAAAFDLRDGLLFLVGDNG
ncbi:MAG: hypothetical protein WBK72_10095 [Bacillota bacterium]